MPEEQVKHLELIQGVVNRLAGNSFAYKGWTIAIVAALFALGTKDQQPAFFLVALLPTIAFWGLDAYYLRQERLFRELYNGVRKMDEDDWHQQAFSMDTKPYVKKVRSWLRTVLSRTIAGLYVPLVLVVGAVAIVAFAGLMPTWPREDVPKAPVGVAPSPTASTVASPGAKSVETSSVKTK